MLHFWVLVLQTKSLMVYPVYLQLALHGTLLSLCSLVLNACICLHITLFPSNRLFSLMFFKVQLSMTWEKFPELNIPLCCLCLFYILLLSTELYFVYVFSFLLGCAFSKDSNSVFTSCH